MQLIAKTSRFKAHVGSGGTDVVFTTDKGVFHFGVDNSGNPYVSTGIRGITLRPSASNRVNIFEERD